MVISSTDNLRALFENIKSLGFFGRIFGWGKIEKLNSVANNEFRTINTELDSLSEQNKQSQIQIQGIYRDLENQKNQYFQLRTDHDVLKNSTANINEELRKREIELGAIKESEQKNSRRIIELEKESDRLRNTIDQYNQSIQEKENELGALKEADSKNTKRIIELTSESERLTSTINRNHESIQEKENELGALKEADSKNTKRIIELANELEKLTSTINRFNESIQERENELGALKEADSKNSKRIIELDRESDKLRTAIEQYTQKLNEKESDLGALKESDSKNTKRIIELEKDAERLRTSIEQYNLQIQEKENDLGGLKESDNKNIKRIAELDKEISLKTFEIQNLINEKIDKEKLLSSFQKADQQKQEQYEHKITELNSLKNQLDTDRIRLQQEREDEIKIQFERMRATWKDHENKVEEAIRGICSRRQIEYLDKEQIPFKGKPDNAIKIAEEYIIFDAKSPSSDDLENFPTYIKNQTEQLKKYVKEKDVNKSLFLVIPTNTIDVIEQFFYNLAEYQVFIVTLDTLEPVIMSLKKIEDYEFAEQLSPEERENICRVIGKFAHATKRRIQIDSYFCGEFINILNNCESLPDDILEKTQDFEKSDKMNPPLEKRAKLISPTQLKKDVRRIKQEAEAQDIDVIVSGSVMEALPLYKTEERNLM